MKTKKAVCGQSKTAENKSHKTFYRPLPVASSLKEQIGQLLLYLQSLPENKRQEQWPVFESELRNFYEVRYER
jgi:hypothetical protein